jgi:hypothetical protein
MTALLVVGSAPCLYDDLAAAKEIFPDAKVLTINGASGLVIGDFILSGHTSQAEEFTALRRERFPDGPAFEVWANWRDRIREGEQLPAERYPSVTHWFGGAVSSGATSAGKAIRMGLQRGFLPVVLCGCPMDGSGYALNEPQKWYTKNCHRVGDAKKQNYPTLTRYRQTFQELAAIEWKDKAFSMSGFTRGCLGTPLDFLN